MRKHFLHLDKIPRWFYQKNVPNAPWNQIYNPADEYNEIGSRFSGKTFMIKDNPIGKSCAISLLVNKPIFIIAVQKMGKDIRKGVFENIQNTLNDMNINYKVNLSEHSFTLDNGTYIICKGLHSTTKREKLKAFADLGKYEFAIEWREEADQLTKEDISELDYAVCGAKRKFIINSSNPESLKRYIIGYCNEIMPFNEELMRLNYDQIGKFKINYYDEKNEKFIKTVIIHYSSWRLNSYLDVDFKRKQLILEKLDPERARVWSWGLPGNTSGSIFARYIDIMQATDIIQPTKLLGGVDLANSTSPKGHTTAASFWIYNLFDKKAYKVAEYTHSNATQQFKGPLEQVKDILEFCNNQLNQYFNLIQQGISINVDDSAYATLESLNREKYNYTFGQYMHFKPAQKQKFKIKHRVEAFTMLINTNQLKWLWEKCPVSKTQYELIQWKDKPDAIEERILDLYDDTFDSDFYALHFELVPMVKHNSSADYKLWQQREWII